MAYSTFKVYYYALPDFENTLFVSAATRKPDVFSDQEVLFSMYDMSLFSFKKERKKLLLIASIHFQSHLRYFPLLLTSDLDEIT